MLAIEKHWKDIGEGEPFTMHAVAMLFRTQSGEPPDKLDMKEVGEFLAGGKPQMSLARNAFVDTFDYTNQTFVQALRSFLGSFRYLLGSANDDFPLEHGDFLAPKTRNTPGFATRFDHCRPFAHLFRVKTSLEALSYQMENDENDDHAGCQASPCSSSG